MIKMLNFSYTTPKSEDTGLRKNEKVESVEKHTFKDSNREILSDELSKLMAKYPDYDLDIKISFKKQKGSK